MKIVLIFVTLIAISYCQVRQWSGNFQYSSSSLGNGYLTGSMNYDYVNKAYKTTFNTLQYSVLYTFNQYYGDNSNLVDPFVDQWRFRMGPGCPGGCETGRVTYGMPQLYLTTATYVPDTPASEIIAAYSATNACYKYKLNPASPAPLAASSLKVTNIWFSSTTPASAVVCKVAFSDQTSFTFTSITQGAPAAGTFDAPTGCKCNNPIDIALVLDRSGSISFGEWNQMFNFLKGFGNAFQWATDKANLAIVNFNTIAWGRYSNGKYLAPPLLGLTGDKTTITNTINAMKCCNTYNNDDTQSCCDGWTSISAGIRAGFDELAKSTRPTADKILVLITDGKQNTLYQNTATPIGGNCYTYTPQGSNTDQICCDYAVGSGCPDDVYGKAYNRNPGSQYLFCLNDLNYDGIPDDWQTTMAGKAANLACGSTSCSPAACGCLNYNNGDTCCDRSGQTTNNCSGIWCTPSSKYDKKAMKNCHLDLINAREYGFNKLNSDKMYIYSVGVGDVATSELEIVSNQRYKRPANQARGSPITWANSIQYNAADKTNPERVMTVSNFDQLTGLIQELTAKICDVPPTPCGACCGECLCGVCNPATACAATNKCNRGIFKPTAPTCCDTEPVPCPPQNCNNTNCDPLNGCLYTPRACVPASDTCYTYACNSATNVCDRTPKFQPPSDKCHKSLCDTSVNPPRLVNNEAIDCSYLADPCNTARCDLGTGSCIKEKKAIPAAPDACHHYVCDPTVTNPGTGPIPAQFKLVENAPCNPVDNCHTAACNLQTGVCEQTELICNNVNNLCELQRCDPALPRGQCPPVRLVDCTVVGDICHTSGSCDTTTGKCVYTSVPNICSDPRCACNSTLYDFCIATDTCVAGTGCVQTEKPCPEDTNKCKILTRNSQKSDCCQYDDKDCDKGDPCFLYGCDPTTGNCTVTPKCPDPSTACFTKGCNSTDGSCYSIPTICPDQPCKINNGCDDVQGGCVLLDRNCDDQSDCTNEYCDVNVNDCVKTDVVCNDGDECTIDKCNPSGGCYTEPVVCDDLNECTIDTCNSTVIGGCVFTPVNGTDYCDDSNLCTIDICDVTVKYCTYEDVICPEPDECYLQICRPNFGCGTKQLLCMLNSTGQPVFRDTTDEDRYTELLVIPTNNRTAEETAEFDRLTQTIAAKKQQEDDEDTKRRDQGICAYAYCQNSTCHRYDEACYVPINVDVIIGAAVTGGVIAGIVIAAVVIFFAAGGGVYYIAASQGIGGLGNVATNPLYEEAATGGTNALYSPDDNQ